MFCDKLGNGACAGIEVKYHLTAGLADILSHLCVEQLCTVRIVLEKRKWRNHEAKSREFLLKLRRTEQHFRPLVLNRIGDRIGHGVEHALQGCRKGKIDHPLPPGREQFLFLLFRQLGTRDQIKQQFFSMRAAPHKQIAEIPLVAHLMIVGSIVLPEKPQCLPKR